MLSFLAKLFSLCAILYPSSLSVQVCYCCFYRYGYDKSKVVLWLSCALWVSLPPFMHYCGSVS